MQPSAPNAARGEESARPRYTKRHEVAEFMFCAAHFWLGESLLALDRGEAAITEYRWILGELDSPLYPIAMLRTAHCHWDAGRAEKARDFLQHVEDRIGDKSSPPWIRSLDRRVRQDLEDFSE